MNRKAMIAITIAFVSFPLFVFGQCWYPVPKPELVANEHYLLGELAKNTSGTKKIDILLRLADLNLYRPVTRKPDMERALAFAKAARDSSMRYNDKKRLEESQLMLGDIISTLNYNIEAAEKILPSLSDTSKIKLYLDLAYKYWFRDKADKKADWQRGLSFAEEARRLSIQYHLPLYEVLAIKIKGYNHMDSMTGEPEKEFLEVLNRYRELKYPKLHYAYIALLEYYFVKGQPDKAEYYCEKAIISINATKDTLVAGDIYYACAVVSCNNDHYQRAFDLDNLAIRYLKIHPGRFSLNNRDPFSLSIRILRKMKKYADAIKYAEHVQSEFPAATPAEQIGDDQMMANIYRDMKKYGKAEKKLLNALAIAKKQPGNLRELYNDIGQLYVESKQYARAKPYLNFVLNDKANLLTSAAKTHLNIMLFLADSATGDYFSAMRHLSAYSGAQEFELRRVKDQNEQKLEVQYETKRKEDMIKILNQKAQLDQIDLKRTELVKNVTAGGIALVSIIAGLLYRQGRLRKKSNETIKRQYNVITQNNELLEKMISEKEKSNERIARKNELLQKLVEEKEWLLKEVHHRVKNNLHSVICLLEAQAAHLENDALRAMENSQRRIYAMSLIHQKLYQSDDVKTIDMAVYIPELMQYLSDSFDIANRIYFRLRVEPANLNASQAIPLALIINEALTNSIKYAFPDGRMGEICIALTEIGLQYKLELSDNGIGIPKQKKINEEDSMGIRLIKGLTKEIKGKVAIKNSNGVKITIIFERDILNDLVILHSDYSTLS